MSHTAANQDVDRHAGLLSEEAILALQLRTQPFTGSPADGDWYTDDSVRAQLGEIKDALISGDDLLLISGTSGSGKSVLLKQLSGHSGPRIQCFSVRGSSRFSTYNLFSGLLEAFKLTPPIEMEDALREVVPCLQALLERNTQGAVVLDDADLVRPEELARLLGSMRFLNSGEDPLLRVLLAAKPTFEAQLPDVLPAGDDLPYATLTVEPFDTDRAIGYLDFRLNQAGHFEEFPFSDKQINTITELAGGTPAGLNMAAAQEINELYAPASLRDLPPMASAGGGFLSSTTVRNILGITAVALIGAGLYLFLPTGRAPATTAQESYTIVAEKLIDTTESRITLVDEEATAAAPGNDDTAASKPAVTSALEPIPESAAEPEPVAEAAAETRLPVAVEPAPTPEPEASPTPPDTTGTDAGQPADTATSANLESANWILVQDPKQYTVQMSASTDRASVARFLRRTALSAPNSIYSFQRDGITWYALVHGLFATLPEARQAIEALPERAKTNQPWIRTIEQIQQLVKKP